MSATTPQAFCDLLEKSGLLTPDQLAEIRSTLPDAAPNVICDRIISSGWVTRWQAKQLLAGRGGFSLKKYKLLEQIGQGGMGAVFKAQQPGLGRIVAIKVMAGEVLKSPQAVARFQREIRSAAALDHPNIVRALDADCMTGTYFLVMEYVSGHDLKTWIKQQTTLPIDWSCQVIRQAADGLQHAFERGFVHRDIKPANLLIVLDTETQQPTVKILDFGLARFRSETHEAGGLTRTGEIMGTPDYIAPEQARSTHEADIRADIFSLGCSLFEMLTGKVPFGGASTMEKLMARALGDAPPVSKFRPEVPPALVAIVARMLARDPAQRYQTPGEVSAALLPFSQGALPLAAATQPIDPAAATSQATPATFPGRNDSTLNRFLDQLAFEPADSIVPSGSFQRATSKTRPSRIRLWAGLATAAVIAIGLAGAGLFSGGGKGPKKNVASVDVDASESQVVNVLKKIDVERDDVRGVFRFEGNMLVMPPLEPSIIKLPFTPPEEYDLKIVAAPRPPNDAFYVGLVAPGNICFGIALDGWGRTVSGINLIDGRIFNDNPSAHAGPVFAQDQPTTLVCSVRRDGIRVVANGKPILEWTDYTRVTEGWRQFVPEPVPFLGTWATEFTVSEITLTPVDSSVGGSSAGDGSAKGLAAKGRKKSKSIAAQVSDQNRIGNWILRNQGTFAIFEGGGERWVNSLAEWPSQTFRIANVSLTSPTMTDESVETLSPLSGLRRLQLNQTAITDATLALLKGWPALIDLNVNETQVTGEGFTHLQHTPTLQYLGASGLKLQPGSLQKIGSLKFLANLDLSGSGVTDAEIRTLEMLPVLNSLYLNGTFVTGAGFDRLKSFPLLSNLYLDSSRLDDEGMKAVCEIPQLTFLSFFATLVTDGGLQHLSKLPNLARISMGGEKLTDAGLQHLAKVKKLNDLMINGGHFDGSGFEALRELPELKVLSVSSGINGTALKAIGQFEKLEYLQIFTDSVFDDDLPHLAGLKACRFIKIGCNFISDEGIEKLRQALPECQIDR